MQTQELHKLFLDRQPLPPLTPSGVWKHELTTTIAQLEVPELVKAGFHLWNDDIERSHKLAQRDKSSEGSFCHAIVHRREGDFSNAKYWYHHVGEHPIFDEIKSTYPEWDPFDFVDWCEKHAHGTATQKQAWLEAVQAHEMQLLLQAVL